MEEKVLFLVLSLVIIAIFCFNRRKIICTLFNKYCVKHTEKVLGIVSELKEDPVNETSLIVDYSSTCMDAICIASNAYYVILVTIDRYVTLKVSKEIYENMRGKIGQKATFYCKKYEWKSSENDLFEEFTLC